MSEDKCVIRVRRRGAPKDKYELVPVTPSSTGTEVSSKLGAPLHIRTPDGMDRAVSGREVPFKMQTDLLLGLGYEMNDLDAQVREDHGYLYSWYAGPPSGGGTGDSEAPAAPTPESSVLMQGMLDKEGHAVIKKWAPRWCVLRGAEIAYYTSSKLDDHKGTISVAGGVLSDAVYKKTNGISIKVGDKTYNFAAHTAEDQIRWLKAIEQARQKDPNEQNLSCRNLRTLPKEALGKVSTTTLELSKNNIALTPDMLKFPQLHTLRLSQNQLDKFPEAACGVPTLQTLDLSRNSIPAVPPSIGRLSQLRVLVLHTNRLKTLPAETGTLTTLRVLVLSFNGLLDIPEPVFGMRALEDLHLPGNDITVLPPQLAQLAGTLRLLDLRRNRLTGDGGGSVVAQLANLEVLDLSRNELNAMPDLSQLTKLKSFECAHQTIPVATLWSAALTKASLQENGLVELKVALQPNLAALTTLNISNNKLKLLPDAITALPNLESLIAKSNELTALPDRIFCMPNLKWLFVGYNHLVELPNTFDGNKCKLQILEVQNCRLRHLPKALSRMYMLRIVNASHNQLRGLPSVAADINAIEEVYLAENRMRDTCVDVLAAMSKLRIIHLGYNRLTAVSPSLAKLSALESLHLVGNQITKLPSQLGSLAALRHLFLGNNRLSELPSLNGLQRLEVLDASNNALSSLPDGLSSLAALHTVSFAGNAQLGVPGSGWLHPAAAQHAQEVLLENVARVDAEPLRKMLGNPAALVVGGSLCGGAYSYGSAELQGRRPRQEDARVVVDAFGGDPTQALVAVFDGHSGPQAAAALRSHFPGEFRAQLQRYGGDVTKAMKYAYLRVHAKLMDEHGTGMRCGSTGTVLHIAGGGGGVTLTVGSVGDTEAVLGRAGKAEVLSKVHHLELPGEYRRVLALGGFESADNRVNGVLAASRALGDFYMQPFVTPLPSVHTATLAASDTCLIVACDGLWDVCTHEQALAAIAGITCPSAAAAKLRDLAYTYGSEDNVTVVVILFAPRRPWSPADPGDDATAEEEAEMAAAIAQMGVGGGGSAAATAATAGAPAVQEVAAMKAFKFVRLLGVGSFGKVVAARKDDTLFAVKIIDRARSDASDIQNEMQMVKFQHPSLVRVFEVHDSPSNVYIVMEFCGGGVFNVPTSPEEAMPDKVVKFYAAQLVHGFHYLHLQKLVYRDMSLKNILMDTAGNVKITDFGLAGLAGTSQKFAGTPAFMAPEMVRKEPYGAPVDWWGLGVVVYALLVGRPPFFADSEPEMYEKILGADIYFPYKLKGDAKKFLKGLLERDAAKRLGSKAGEEDVLKHAYIKDVKLEKIAAGKIKPPHIPPAREVTPQDASVFDGWI